MDLDSRRIVVIRFVAIYADISVIDIAVLSFQVLGKKLFYLLAIAVRFERITITPYFVKDNGVTCPFGIRVINMASHRVC